MAFEKGRKPVVVISTNTAWNIFNFRAGLVRALIAKGYDVVAVAPHDEYAPRLSELGCRFVPLPMDNNGTNPFRDFVLLLRYFQILLSVRPAAFLSYTVKPNVYGSIAAQALGIPVLNNIAGLGATFIRTSHVTKIVRGLYRLALKHSYRVFFQNDDDRELFIKSGLVAPALTSLVPGSGIALENYPVVSPEPLQGRRFRFVLVARMLRDKGVEEYVQAVAIVRERFPETTFQLLGSLPRDNPNAVSAEQIQAWEKQGIVEYLGVTDDVRPFLQSADCVVLPSYREGVPRSLLEAAGMARPIVTTDVVGCREAVEHDVNGYLCKVKDPRDLAEKMMMMVAQGYEQRLLMGMAGRAKVEREFDEQLVIQKYLFALRELMVVHGDNDNTVVSPIEEETLSET